MDQTTLRDALRRRAPFPNDADAQAALTETLATLGALLPERQRRALHDALPAAYSELLTSHGAASASERGPAALHEGRELERMQEVCALLGEVLPTELVVDLMRELPVLLAAAFSGSAAEGAPATHHTPHTRRDGARHLSEARPGATHTLANGRPGAAQQESVAADNPHQDSKLSSARGLTQERESESLADTTAPRARRKNRRR